MASKKISTSCDMDRQLIIYSMFIIKLAELWYFVHIRFVSLYLFVHNSKGNNRSNIQLNMSVITTKIIKKITVLYHIQII